MPVLYEYRTQFFIIAEPADALAPNGARPSAGSVLTEELDTNGLVQHCSISIANALEILQSCTKPLIFFLPSFSGHQWFCIGLILGLCPANERWRYFVTASFIGWAQALNQPCCITYIN